MKDRRFAVGLAALALIAAACGGGAATGAPSVAPTSAASSS